MLKDKINKLDSSKKELRDYIILNEDMSYEDKIHLLCEHKIYDINSYYVDSFEIFKDELNKFKKEVGESSNIEEGNDMFEFEDRYSVVLFSDILEYTEWEDVLEDDNTICLFKDVISKKTYNISKEEFIKGIYVYMIVNRIIGFKYDW